MPCLTGLFLITSQPHQRSEAQRWCPASSPIQAHPAHPAYPGTASREKRRGPAIRLSMNWQALRPRPFSRVLAVPGLVLMMLSRRNWPVLRFVIRTFGWPGVRTPPPQAKGRFRFQWTFELLPSYWALIEVQHLGRTFSTADRSKLRRLGRVNSETGK